MQYFISSLIATLFVSGMLFADDDSKIQAERLRLHREQGKATAIAIMHTRKIERSGTREPYHETAQRSGMTQADAIDVMKQQREELRATRQSLSSEIETSRTRMTNRTAALTETISRIETGAAEFVKKEYDRLQDQSRESAKQAGQTSLALAKNGINTDYAERDLSTVSKKNETVASKERPVAAQTTAAPEERLTTAKPQTASVMRCDDPQTENMSSFIPPIKNLPIPAVDISSINSTLKKTNVSSEFFGAAERFGDNASLGEAGVCLVEVFPDFVAQNIVSLGGNGLSCAACLNGVSPLCVPCISSSVGNVYGLATDVGECMVDKQFLRQELSVAERDFLKQGFAISECAVNIVSSISGLQWLQIGTALGDCSINLLSDDDMLKATKSMRDSPAAIHTLLKVAR